MAVLQDVERFLATEPGNIIGGEVVASRAGGRFEVHDPATGSLLTTVPSSMAADIDAADAVGRRSRRGASWPHRTLAPVAAAGRPDGRHRLGGSADGRQRRWLTLAADHPRHRPVPLLHRARADDRDRQIEPRRTSTSTPDESRPAWSSDHPVELPPADVCYKLGPALAAAAPWCQAGRADATVGAAPGRTVQRPGSRPGW